MAVFELPLVLASTGAALVRGPTARSGEGFDSVTHDTREAQPGSLYFALRGERADGAEFVAQAEAAGATGVVVARGAGAKAAASTKTAAVFEVDEPLLALGRLARAWRRTLPTTVLALTGSVGKTSTKEMLAAILEAAVGAGAVHKTRGNLNNHIGVPLTLLSLRPSHRYAVVELGMSSLGEIAYLEGLARPDLALVTRVAGVHLEQLGSIERVAQAKGEIFEGRASTGAAWAIHPHAEPLLATSLERVPAVMRRSFGEPGADFAVEWAVLDGDGTQLRLSLQGRVLEARLGILGEHQARNAAAAAAAASVLGIDEAAIAKGLAAVRSEKHRMQILKIGGRIVLDDCYNASPPSVRAALDALRGLGAAGARRVAVLGDMLELGPGGPAEHAAIGRHAAGLAAEVIGFGTLSRETVAAAKDTLGEAAVHVSDVEEAARRVVGATKPGDVVLVKGSRGMKLERVIDAMARYTEAKD